VNPYFFRRYRYKMDNDISFNVTYPKCDKKAERERKQSADTERTCAYGNADRETEDHVFMLENHIAQCRHLISPLRFAVFRTNRISISIMMTMTNFTLTYF